MGAAGSGGGAGCVGWYCSSTRLRPTSAKMIPPVRSIADDETPQFSSNARPAKPPTTTAITAITNARTAIARAVASSASRVSCVNGPRIFSGPSVMKNSVNIAPKPTRASGVLGIAFSRGCPTLALAHCVDVAIQEEGQERADRCDGGDPADLLPVRGDGGVHDVGGELEGETGDKPAGEFEPNGALFHVARVRPQVDAKEIEYRFHCAYGDGEQRQRLQHEREVVRGQVEDFFHDPPTRKGRSSASRSSC